MGPADVAWCVLARDATNLLQDYESGQWLPYEGELRFAEDLARLQWTETLLRAAQRTASAYGRLPLLLDNACFVLRYTDGRDPALLPLRRLVDVLADDAEQEPTTAAAAAGTASGRVRTWRGRRSIHEKNNRSTTCSAAMTKGPGGTRRTATSG